MKTLPWCGPSDGHRSRNISCVSLKIGFLLATSSLCHFSPGHGFAAKLHNVPLTNLMFSPDLVFLQLILRQRNSRETGLFLRITSVTSLRRCLGDSGGSQTMVCRRKLDMGKPRVETDRWELVNLDVEASCWMVVKPCR